MFIQHKSIRKSVNYADKERHRSFVCDLETVGKQEADFAARSEANRKDPCNKGFCEKDLLIIELKIEN